MGLSFFSMRFPETKRRVRPRLRMPNFQQKSELSIRLWSLLRSLPIPGEEKRSTDYCEDCGVSVVMPCVRCALATLPEFAPAEEVDDEVGDGTKCTTADYTPTPGEIIAACDEFQAERLRQFDKSWLLLEQRMRRERRKARKKYRLRLINRIPAVEGKAP
jgi:hypothetical protein